MSSINQLKHAPLLDHWFSSSIPPPLLNGPGKTSHNKNKLS